MEAKAFLANESEPVIKKVIWLLRDSNRKCLPTALAALALGISFLWEWKKKKQNLINTKL